MRQEGLYLYSNYNKWGECLVKVGMAEDLEKRLKQHRTSCGGMEVLATIDKPWCPCTTASKLLALCNGTFFGGGLHLHPSS